MRPWPPWFRSGCDERMPCSSSAVADRVRAAIEQQLTVADRLTSVGTLAAGVAHEINNPLAAVMVNLQLAQEDVSALEEKGAAPELATHLREELRDAAVACERVK